MLDRRITQNPPRLKKANPQASSSGSHSECAGFGGLRSAAFATPLRPRFKQALIEIPHRPGSSRSEGQGGRRRGGARWHAVLDTPHCAEHVGCGGTLLAACATARNPRAATPASGVVSRHHEQAVRQRQRDPQPIVATGKVIHTGFGADPLGVGRLRVEHVAVVEAIVDDHDAVLRQ